MNCLPTTADVHNEQACQDFCRKAVLRFEDIPCSYDSFEGDIVGCKFVDIYIKYMSHLFVPYLFSFIYQAQLIMQVLSLTDEQIALLSPDQRQSIMMLREQLGKAKWLVWFCWKVVIYSEFCCSSHCSFISLLAGQSCDYFSFFFVSVIILLQIFCACCHEPLLSTGTLLLTILSLYVCMSFPTPELRPYFFFFSGILPPGTRWHPHGHFVQVQSWLLVSVSLCHGLSFGVIWKKLTFLPGKHLSPQMTFACHVLHHTPRSEWVARSNAHELYY